MRRRGGGRAAVARDRAVALALFAAATVALGLGEIALLATDGIGAPFPLLVLIPATGWVYVMTGVLAWVRRPSNRMGPLLCAGGLMWFAAGAVNIAVPAFAAVGLITQTLTIALAVHALLAFPSGRLPDALSRGVTVAIYAVALVGQAPLYLFAPPQPPFDVLQIADRPALLALGHRVQAVAGAVVLVAAAAVLLRRLVVADRQRRRVLLPVYGTGAVVVVGVTSSVNLARALGIDPLVLGVFQLALAAVLPVAFVAGVLLGGFARTGELEELGVWLGASGGERPGLRDALARTLGDPTLTLAFRVGAGWVDADGVPAQLPTRADRTAVTVELDGRPVGAITYDATLIADAEPVRAAGRIVAIAVDHERLTAQLLASQEQLRDSRTRIVEAGDRERRRLAQDLHDRLQGRLTVLALRVGSAVPGDDLTEIRRGLDETITELRWLVQGVMPALLVERGLVAAVEDMADRLPIRTVLRVDADDLHGARLPASVEGTAYHVVAEALTNAVKHAQATALTVVIGREAGLLRIEVVDDGVGGAAPVGGAGLRGMADRVHALGGQLAIDSRPGAGTRLTVEMPCVS